MCVISKTVSRSSVSLYRTQPVVFLHDLPVDSVTSGRRHNRTIQTLFVRADCWLAARPQAALHRDHTVIRYRVSVFVRPALWGCSTSWCLACPSLLYAAADASTRVVCVLCIIHVLRHPAVAIGHRLAAVCRDWDAVYPNLMNVLFHLHY